VHLLAEPRLDPRRRRDYGGKMGGVRGGCGGAMFCDKSGVFHESGEPRISWHLFGNQQSRRFRMKDNELCKSITEAIAVAWLKHDQHGLPIALRFSTLAAILFRQNEGNPCKLKLQFKCNS
jgi:hypothetical protein